MTTLTHSNSTFVCVAIFHACTYVYNTTEPGAGLDGQPSPHGEQGGDSEEDKEGGGTEGEVTWHGTGVL